jgi:hypothetical protein
MKSIKRPNVVNLELEDLSGCYGWVKNTQTEQYIGRLENLVDTLECEVERLIESIKHIEKCNNFIDSKDEVKVLDDIYRDSQ